MTSPLITIGIAGGTGAGKVNLMIFVFIDVTDLSDLSSSIHSKENKCSI
jgi:hypothetical protein